jgi:hypothetical protein
LKFPTDASNVAPTPGFAIPIPALTLPFSSPTFDPDLLADMDDLIALDRETFVGQLEYVDSQSKLDMGYLERRD